MRPSGFITRRLSEKKSDKFEGCVLSCFFFFPLAREYALAELGFRILAEGSISTSDGCRARNDSVGSFSEKHLY